MSRARYPGRSWLVAALAVVFAGCPAPPTDDDAPWADAEFDAQPLDPPLRNPSGAPTCAPESIIDVTTAGVRTGSEIHLRVDTSASRNDLRTLCVPRDGPEVVLRYRVPTLAEARVKAVRITTISPMTTFDTVLGIRPLCTPEARDLSCSNDAYVADGHRTRQSTVYQVDTVPEDSFFVLVDGFDGAAGVADVTVTEIPELGVLGAPCVPIPPQRAMDPTAPTGQYRCPHAGIRCSPGAAPDGTDLCLRVVAIGQPCDFERRFDVCERMDEGAECARNPSNETQVRCALPGTAPGARCRGAHGSPNRCDAGLVCSEGLEVGDRDECVPIRHAGETCDAATRGFINRCDVGLECCASAADAGTTTYCRPIGSGGMCYQPPQ
jgi:hypothetical protein